jgi:hypothetical protein
MKNDASAVIGTQIGDGGTLRVIIVRGTKKKEK